MPGAKKLTDNFDDADHLAKKKVNLPASSHWVGIILLRISLGDPARDTHL